MQKSTSFKGSTHEEDFMIFHDALTAWWEPQAQLHMKELGFEHRQLQAYGDTNKGTRYHRKLVGDSPEICRGLDAHCFADLERIVAFNCAVSSSYEVGDPRRFNMGTPTEVAKTLFACWKLVPEKRLIEDICAFEGVLDKIIEANAASALMSFCVWVGDRGAPTARQFHPEEQKPKTRQRKSTIISDPLHERCIEAYTKPKQNQVDKVEAFVADISAGKNNIFEDIESESTVPDIDYTNDCILGADGGGNSGAAAESSAVAALNECDDANVAHDEQSVPEVDLSPDNEDQDDQIRAAGAAAAAASPTIPSPGQKSADQTDLQAADQRIRDDHEEMMALYEQTNDSGAV